MIKVLDVIWYSLFSANPHAIGIVKVEADNEIRYYIGTGEGNDKKEDVQKIIDGGFRFYPEIFGGK